jgi:hypothetical protein
LLSEEIRSSQHNLIFAKSSKQKMKSQSKHAPAVPLTTSNLTKFDQEENEESHEIQHSLEDLIRGWFCFTSG